MRSTFSSPRNSSLAPCNLLHCSSMRVRSASQSSTRSLEGYASATTPLSSASSSVVATTSRSISNTASSAQRQQRFKANNSTKHLHTYQETTPPVRSPALPPAPRALAGGATPPAIPCRTTTAATNRSVLLPRTFTHLHLSPCSMCAPPTRHPLPPRLPPSPSLPGRCCARERTRARANVCPV